MAQYIAFGSYKKFESWLEVSLKVGFVQADRMVQAFLQSSLSSFVQALKLTSDEEAVLEDGGIILRSSNIERLLDIIDAFRYKVPVSTIFRFASWGISIEQPEEAKKSALYTDLPDSVVVASATVPLPAGVTRSNISLAGRMVPSELTYVYSKSDSGRARVNTCCDDIELNKATAFGDIGGFKDWLLARSELPKEIRDKVPTRLANSLLSLIEDGSDRTQKVLRPERSLGIGTDGVYLTSSSHDSLLRLIIWVQCSLACEGVALSVWGLNSGHPQYNRKRQPSGDDYFRLLEMVKGKINGDIVVTESFIQHLTRPELSNLITSQPVGEEGIHRVLWWEYPFRVAARGC